MYIVFQHYLNVPYPYLIQVLTISKDLKVSSDFYNETFIYKVVSTSVLHKLDFSSFMLWYLNSWNSNLGYKNQYLNIGFRFVFSYDNDVDISKDFVINQPLDKDFFVKRYGVNFSIKC